MSQLTPEQTEVYNNFLEVLKDSWVAHSDPEQYWQEQTEKVLAAIERSHWVVEIKEAGTTLEISAVIEGSHGHKSWGWHDGVTKHVVLSISNTLKKQAPLPKHIIDLVILEAQKICDEKNK